MLVVAAAAVVVSTALLEALMAEFATTTAFPLDHHELYPTNTPTRTTTSCEGSKSGGVVWWSCPL